MVACTFSRLHQPDLSRRPPHPALGRPVARRPLDNTGAGSAPNTTATFTSTVVTIALDATGHPPVFFDVSRVAASSAQPATTHRARARPSADVNAPLRDSPPETIAVRVGWVATSRTATSSEALVPRCGRGRDGTALYGRNQATACAAGEETSARQVRAITTLAARRGRRPNVTPWLGGQSPGLCCGSPGALIHARAARGAAGALERARRSGPVPSSKTSCLRNREGSAHTTRRGSTPLPMRRFALDDVVPASERLPTRRLDGRLPLMRSHSAAIRRRPSSITARRIPLLAAVGPRLRAAPAASTLVAGCGLAHHRAKASPSMCGSTPTRYASRPRPPSGPRAR